MTRFVAAPLVVAVAAGGSLFLGGAANATPGSATFTGIIHDETGMAIAAASVQACPASPGPCVTAASDINGVYNISVTPGSWNLSAYPPTDVTYATLSQSNVSKNLTLSQLQAIFRRNQPVNPGDPPCGTIHPRVPQVGSGVRDFWNKLVGPFGSCVDTTNSIVQNDGAILGNDPNAIAPYGVGAWVTQTVSRNIVDHHGLAVLRGINGYPPFANMAPLLLPDFARTLNIGAGATVTQNFILRRPTAPPPGTTVTSSITPVDGVPVVNWADPFPLATTQPSGGTASYAITLNSSGDTIQSGSLTESPIGSGNYQAQIPALSPSHGPIKVCITISYPGNPTITICFTVYIDPSGTVVTPAGAPLADATVTLLSSDTATGPFTPVGDGSDVMSPSNRTNPDVTGFDGMFHWDVIGGFYQIQATKQGCRATDGSSAATSAVYEIPPPATDIQLVLDCGP
ncbi:MAG TPA: hypothetical protein VFO16_02750 [Pseudonocardiaceae bacterium]|nr:hypothetical protein [Pseudonocardiaceae bacterium]